MVLSEVFLWGRQLRESREMPQLGHQLGTRAQEHQQHWVLQNNTPKLQATEGQQVHAFWAELYYGVWIFHENNLGTDALKDPIRSSWCTNKTKFPPEPLAQHGRS